jgi:hypothetical protein
MAVSRRQFLKNAGWVGLGMGVGALVISPDRPGVGVAAPGCEPTTTTATATTLPPTTTVTTAPPTTTTTIIPTTWVPPMGPVSVPYSWPTPDVTLNPGDSVRTAYNNGKRKIRLNPGDYGTQVLGSMPGAIIWCETYRGAFFHGGGAAFVLKADNMILGNLRIENYKMHSTAEEGAMLQFNGTNQWAINCAVGKATNNAYCVKGSKSGILGGEIFECGRYAWTGGGVDNTFRDIFCKTIATNTSSSNRGVTKTVFSQRHTVQRICGIDIRWNGIWFDIQNQPALIEDIFFDNIWRSVVFIEVSYGGENQDGVWKWWRIRRIGGIRPQNKPHGDKEGDWPVPAVLLISSTSDLDVDGVYGSGFRCGVSLLNDANHKQITGEIGSYDRKRAGLQNITIRNQDTPGTFYAVAAVAGRAHEVYPEMKQPTGIAWVSPIWRSGDKFRDVGGFVTQAQFETKYAA